jgi:hypothetical protein
MSVDNLLAELKRRGVTLRADGDKLYVRAPVGALTDELRQAIRARKAEIMATLRGDYVVVPIERLRDFLAEHGLEVVGGGWPDGEVRPVLWVRKNGAAKEIHNSQFL